ncbi:MAG: abortive infection family protein [Acidimicrobiia bacterium]
MSAAVIDALGPIRNKWSMAHPNEDLLEPGEATLVINVARSLLRYLADKVAPDPISEAGRSEQLDMPF